MSKALERLAQFGYVEVKGEGARKKFVNRNSKISINLHEPNPTPILKAYAIELIIEHLKEEGLL